MKDVLMKGFKVLKNNKRLLKWEERNPVEISKISTKKQKEYFYIWWFYSSKSFIKTYHYLKNIYAQKPILGLISVLGCIANSNG